MTASWLAQMGWDVYVLIGGFDGSIETGDVGPALPPRPAVPDIDVERLRTLPDRAVTIIDLATSRQHRAGHIPGARFALRRDLPAIVAGMTGQAVVLTCPQGALAAFAAQDLGSRDVRVLAGGTAAWTAAGYDVERGLEAPLSEPTDVYKRPYEGTDNAMEAMQAYLDWEFGLVAQLQRDGSHGFFVV